MFTPASKANLKKIKSEEEVFDPRSPSNVIQRTPITSVLKAKAEKKHTEAELLKILDPRSPTIGITRTPMDLKNMKFVKKADGSTPNTNESKTSKVKIEDPRSPTFGIARTPMPCVSKDIKRVLSSEHPALFDPRSPSTDIERTPFNLPASDDSKAQLKKEELKDNVVKKIEFSSFSDSQASSTLDSVSRQSLDDNSVECANVTDESINDASFVSPLPSDNCVFSTPCAKNEQSKFKVCDEFTTKSNFTPFVCDEEVFSTPKNLVNRFAQKHDKKVLGRSPLSTLGDVNSPRIKQNKVCKK